VKERLLLALHVILFAFVALFLATLQTSLWFQVMGSFPSPSFWIPVLVYIALNRSSMQAVVTIYLMCILLSTMTTMPEGILILVCILLGLSAQVFKQRIQWPGQSYFMIVCGSAALLFHVFYWVISLIIEEHPLTNPQVSDWLIEALLTPLIAPFLYRLFVWLDSWFEYDQLAPSGRRGSEVHHL
jgi:cell shape-determining protein MreD